MNNRDYYLPQHLDTPEYFLFWDIEEGMALFTPILLGASGGHGFLGLILGISAYFFVKKVLKENGQNMTFYFIYNHFPHSSNIFKWMPPSYIKEYIG